MLRQPGTRLRIGGKKRKKSAWPKKKNRRAKRAERSSGEGNLVAEINVSKNSR